MLTREFLESQRERLTFRRKTKRAILCEGGEQALSHSHKDITRIDFALARIDEGQYGICTECGCLIGEKRLSIIPEAPHCTACAEAIEMQ